MIFQNELSAEEPTPINSTSKNLGIAWCSWQNNSIGISSNITKENIGTDKFFAGAQLGNLPGQLTLIEHIPDTEFIISSVTNTPYCNFEIYDTSAGCKSSFRAGKTPGVIYDIASNSRTKVMALLSLERKASYHVYSTVDWQLLHKAPWNQFQQKAITGLDFESDGEKIATVSQDGVLVIANRIHDDVLLVRELGGNSYSMNKCRWNSTNSLIALSFSDYKLNFLDPSKDVMTLKENLKPHLRWINWISWRADSNILACCSDDCAVSIVDFRRGNVVKDYNGFHMFGINSVRWSHCGYMLATASSDSIAKVIDIRSERVLKSFQTNDGSNDIMQRLSLLISK